MKISKIFLDLDDVLNSFTMYALQHVGCPVNAFDFEAFNPAWGWDIVKAANALHKTTTFTVDGFWTGITREVWATAPPSNEGTFLYDESVKLVGPQNVCILSSPTLDPDSLAGKLEWIQKNLPKQYQRQFLIGPRKEMCAQPGALLIDDSDHNVDAFRMHGGQAILMPRPWNSLNEVSMHKTTLNYLKGAFTGLKIARGAA